MIDHILQMVTRIATIFAESCWLTGHCNRDLFEPVKLLHWSILSNTSDFKKVIGWAQQKHVAEAKCHGQYPAPTIPPHSNLMSVSSNLFHVFVPSGVAKGGNGDVALPFCPPTVLPFCCAVTMSLHSKLQTDDIAIRPKLWHFCSITVWLI